MTKKKKENIEEQLVQNVEDLVKEKLKSSKIKDKDIEKYVEKKLKIPRMKLNLGATYKSKKRYYAVFLLREQNTFNVISKKRFNPEQKTIRYKKGNSHEIDPTIPTYSKGINLYYLIDIKEGQLEFGNHTDKTQKKINPELIDMILEQGIIEQLTANLQERSYGNKILSMITNIIMGFLIGFIAGGFLLP